MRWNSHHGPAGWHVADRDGAGADRRIVADCQPAQEPCAGADESPLAGASETDTRPDMGACPAPAIVIDGGPMFTMTLRPEARLLRNG